MDREEIGIGLDLVREKIQILEETLERARKTTPAKLYEAIAEQGRDEMANLKAEEERYLRELINYGNPR